MQLGLREPRDDHWDLLGRVVRLQRLRKLGGCIRPLPVLFFPFFAALADAPAHLRLEERDLSVGITGGRRVLQEFRAVAEPVLPDDF